MKIVGFIRSMGKEQGISPVSYYRTALPLKALDIYTKHSARSYDQFEMASMFQLALEEGKDPDEPVRGHDVYVLSRLYREDGADDFVGAVHEEGGLLVFDTDDDLTEEYRDLDGRGWEFIEQLKRVDLVTVSTPYLAKRMAKYTDHKPVVLPNHVDFDWFSQTSLLAKRRFDDVTVGVIGTQTHAGDWVFLKDAFRRLNDMDGVTVLSAGFQPDYMEGYEHLSGVPYKYYPQLMRQFDIVCCALDPDDGFNLSKSSVKALESMASARRLPNGKIGGAVAVCTDMTLYRRTVNHMHNGLLVDNGDWYEALKMLVEDVRMRTQIAYRGHRWVRGNRDIKSGYRMWKRAYLNLLEGHYGRHQRI
jgi:glycosyltransferase involved in cell wall biosynthesis